MRRVRRAHEGSPTPAGRTRLDLGRVARRDGDHGDRRRHDPRGRERDLHDLRREPAVDHGRHRDTRLRRGSRCRRVANRRRGAPPPIRSPRTTHRPRATPRARASALARRLPPRNTKRRSSPRPSRTATPKFSEQWCVSHDASTSLDGAQRRRHRAHTRAALPDDLRGRHHRPPDVLEHQLERDDRAPHGAGQRIRRAGHDAGRDRATIRTGTACTTNFTITPTWTLNNPAQPLRADCYVLSASSAQRNDLLVVCTSAGPTPCDSQALLRANVIFYDKPSFGSSIGIQTWSNQ